MVIIIFIFIIFLICILDQKTFRDGFSKYERKKQIQKELNWKWFENLSEYEKEVWYFGMFSFQKELILEGIDDNPQIVMDKAKKQYKVDEAYRNINQWK